MFESDDFGILSLARLPISPPWYKWLADNLEQRFY